MYVQRLQSEQKHSKKRTKSSREKPKKLKQRDDSVLFSDEDSITSKSVSCSSPGNDSRSKKRGRSRDKRRRKDKKRSKKSTLLSESSGDDSPCAKKLKKSKRKRGSDSRKKRHVKRRKRDRSVSSSSSRSRSCSVGEPSGDSEREFGKKEEKVESKERKGREKDRKKSGSKRSRHRSRSCSPCSVHSESSSHYNEERVFEKSNPKRLKSVIVVMKDREVPEEQELNKDDRHEDEIVFEYDDYPSKSNDSIDGVSGREAVSCMHDVSSKKRSLDEPSKDSVASAVRTSDIPGIQRRVVEGSAGLSPSYVKSGDNVPSMENRSADLTSNAGSNHVDLEAILRQKALENLLKRQGKLSTKTTFDKKDDHDVEVKRSSIVKAQPIDQPTPRDEGNIKLVPNVGKNVNDVRYFSNTTNLPGPLEDTGLSKDNNADLLRANVGTAHTEEKSKASGDFVNSRPNVGLSMSRKDFLGAKNTWKRQLISQESLQKNVSTPKETIVRNTNERLMSLDNSLSKLSVPQETISKDSTRDSASHQIDSEDRTFQQKTMSVMRGGEMVQVRYKVYIPKKAPALARRQLKR
uniref:Uncharacterized protein n=1 Tax=Chenopodium quinoa TaxID=63459 RepID=A0A803LVG7_CHEQI